MLLMAEQMLDVVAMIVALLTVPSFNINPLTAKCPLMAAKDDGEEALGQWMCFEQAED